MELSYAITIGIFVKLPNLDTAQKTILAVTLVAISLITGFVVAVDVTHSASIHHQNTLQPNVPVFCAKGTYLADHHCVSSCPSGYSPVTWDQGESSVCMSPDNRPVSIYDLAADQVSSDNGRTVFFVVVTVPLTKVSITQQILSGQTGRLFLPVSESVLVSLAEDATIPAVTTEVATIGDRAGMFRIFSIGVDSLFGNITFAYPLCCPQQARTIHVGDDVGIACAGWSEILQRIDYSSQIAVFTRTTGLQGGIGGCPICLSGDTMIDTPIGPVNVKNLELGMPVWTIDKSGNRVLGTIVELRRTAVPVTDEIVHLVLVDGRQLYASANHPTTDGRTVGQLKPGAALDGSTVETADFLPYNQGYTYDLLPSGNTGFYWASGILLGSTLTLG